MGDPNRNRKIVIVVIIIIGFAAMSFAMWLLYRHFEHKYTVLRDLFFNRANEVEFRMVEIEYTIDQKDRMNAG